MKLAPNGSGEDRSLSNVERMILEIPPRSGDSPCDEAPEDVMS